MAERAIFVDGPLDGQRREVETMGAEMRVLELTRQIVAMKAPILEPVPYVEHVYRPYGRTSRGTTILTYDGINVRNPARPYRKRR